MIYLKTSHACDLYSIKVAKNNKNNSYNYIYADSSLTETMLEQLAQDIKNCMVNYWGNRKWENHISGDDNKYWYVTTGVSSHLKKLRIICSPNLIEEVANTSTCQYNYFKTRNEAIGLLNLLKVIILKYGIAI